MLKILEICMMNMFCLIIICFYIIFSNQELTWDFFFFLFRTLRSDDVSVKITHCGVCYADLIWCRNALGDSKYPLVPG